MGVRTLDLEPGSPWEKGYIERCNRRLRDELLGGELFYALWEAQMVIERLRQAYNGVSDPIVRLAPLASGPRDNRATTDVRLTNIEGSTTTGGRSPGGFQLFGPSVRSRASKGSAVPLIM